MARGQRGTARSRKVEVAVSDDEHSAWTAAREVSSHGQMGSWVREVVNAHVGLAGARAPVPARGVDADVVAALVEQLRGVRRDFAPAASNLNQATARLNRAGVEPATAARLAAVAQQCAAIGGMASLILGEVYDRGLA